MNMSKIIIIIVALGAAIGAMMLANSLNSTPAPIAQVETVIQETETVDILVASTMMLMGHKVGVDDIKWQKWPKDMVYDNMIVRNEQENKMQEAVDSVVKTQIDEGDPIRFSKLIDPKGGGLLSALLAPGMRAISTPISPETGAGGFILPNDKVDVLLTMQNQQNQNKTRTILVNIKVLAIDQTIREEDGQQVVVGKTATLELSSSQSEILAMANNEGSLTLSLRSLADRNIVGDQGLKQKKKLTILRHGKS